ncbi:MAG TPA: hypothetical protein VKZ63_11750, partial [Kofleriaceae bacterium]|nr:hypothetical protein [Kofleriaceae bacterium]
APIEDAEREVALGWLASPVELDAAHARQMGLEARRGVYRAAVRLAQVDLELVAQERALLERLRDALGLEAADAAAIEAEG